MSKPVWQVQFVWKGGASSDILCVCTIIWLLFFLSPAMASSISSQVEQCLCSICQDLFTDPVTIPCGHNFCMQCITQHWDSSMATQCPLCKKNFHLRPELGINREFRELIEGQKRGESPVQPGAVPCDACTNIKRGALKSCMHCEGSFCKTHLEPHNTVAKLKKHKLINPVENLEDYICPKHERPLELFCRDDQKCVCLSCTKKDHKTHNTVPVEKESEERRVRDAWSVSVLQWLSNFAVKKVVFFVHSLS